jgi:hypothetical protein
MQKAWKNGGRKWEKATKARPLESAKRACGLHQTNAGRIGRLVTTIAELPLLLSEPAAMREA